jgi:hypothetical protein
MAAFEYFANVASTKHGVRPDLEAREAIAILKLKLERWVLLAAIGGYSFHSIRLTVSMLDFT